MRKIMSKRRSSAQRESDFVLENHISLNLFNLKTQICFYFVVHNADSMRLSPYKGTQTYQFHQSPQPKYIWFGGMAGGKCFKNINLDKI